MIFCLLAVLALGPEKRVTDPPRVVATYVSSQTPRVATDGKDFLVVWNGGQAAARIDSEGEILDRPSLRIPAPPNVRFHDVIRHGDRYLIGWYYFTDFGSVRLRVSTIESQLFDVELPNADINSDSFQLISNGSALGAMYRLKTGETALTILGSGRSVVLPVSGEVATDGTNFFILQRTSAVLVTSVGDRLASVPLPFTASDVIFAAGEYVVVGTNARQIEMIRMSPAGLLVAPPAVIEIAGGSVTGLTVSNVGSDLLTTWKETYAGPSPFSAYTVSLQARSFSIFGAPLATTLDVPMNEVVGRFAGSTDPPALASNGRDYLLVWTEGTALLGDPGRKLFSLLLHPAEALTLADLDRREKSIPTAIATQLDATSARDGDGLLLAWSENFTTDDSAIVQQQIVAARLTPDGQNLDGAGVIVAPNSSNQHFPAAGWDGSRTWITWDSDYRGIQATYLLADATRPSASIRISSGGYAPRIACGDDTCLVVWAENRSHDTNQHELFAARIVHGELLDIDGFLIGSGHSDVGPGDYALATDGSRFLVVWADRIFNGGAILHSVFFGPLTAGTTTRNSDLAATTARYSSPQVAWNGSEYDVLWGETSTMRASRVSAEGTSIDGDATGWAGTPVAGPSGGPTGLVAVDKILYVASGSSLGQFDPATFAVIGSAEVGSPITIAALDAEHVFVAYPRELEDSFGYPLFLRRVTEMRRRSVPH